MTTTITLARLRDLRLGGMAQALERQQERLIRQARFKIRASVQNIDYQHSRNIKQAQIAQLAQA